MMNWKRGTSTRVSTRAALLGSLLSLALGCAKAVLIDGSDPGSSSNGGSTGTGGGRETGGSTGTGGNGSGTGGNVITGTGGKATGGSTGTGGSSPTGGSTGTGGRATGGSTGTGGGRETGGSTGTGGSSTGGSTGTGGTTTSCTITPSASPSSKIPTVGIVTFTTTLASPTSASIKFGLDTTYGLTAPVDLTQASYRTLLLGMKASKTYHYQITVTNSTGSCTSSDQMIATGALPNGIQTLTVTTNNASALAGGFLVTGQYSQNAGSSGAPAFILDKDGDYVWWYSVPSADATGVAMSYDGKYMWIATANVPDSSATDHVHRVTMDGLTDTDFTTAFAHHSHQVTPLPDGSVAFYTTGSNGCDDIKLFPANGTTTSTATLVVNAKTAHGGSGACHLNNIQYSPSDDTLVFSDLDNNCLTKVTKTGTAVWVLNGGVSGGPTSSFNNGAIVWKGGEHGFHILSGDGTDYVLFNNNSKAPAGSGTSWGSAAGDGSGSMAVEVKLDLTAKTATQTWSYKGTGLDNQVLGDVQRLPNGNTIIDFATKSTVQEVDSKGTLLQQIVSGKNFGYIEKRPTLYGPPPR